MVYLLCKYGKRTTSEPEKSLRQLTAILMSCLFQRSSYFRPNHLWSQRYYQATATSYHQMRSHFFWTLSKWTKTISNPSWMLRSIKTMIKWNKIGFQSKNVTNWIAKIKFTEYFCFHGGFAHFVFNVWFWRSLTLWMNTFNSNGVYSTSITRFPYSTTTNKYD